MCPLASLPFNSLWAQSANICMHYPLCECTHCILCTADITCTLLCLSDFVHPSAFGALPLNVGQGKANKKEVRGQLERVCKYSLTLVIPVDTLIPISFVLLDLKGKLLLGAYSIQTLGYSNEC